IKRGDQAPGSVQRCHRLAAHVALHLVDRLARPQPALVAAVVAHPTRHRAPPFGKSVLGPDRPADRGARPGWHPSRMTEARIPRDPDDDYSPGAVKARQEFVREQTGVTPTHTATYSLDPATLPGNIEHFFGVA